MHINDDLISVVIPVYKVERFLAKCVESVLNQDYKNLEIILVDDGSPDECPVLCDKYTNIDARVHVIHKTNGGQSSARNAGLKIAQGEYVCFVDSDDYIASDMISTLYLTMSDKNADIAKIDHISVNGIRPNVVKIESKKISLYENNNVEKAFLDLNIDSVCTCMYKRKLIKGLNFIEGRISEDIPFNFEAFKRAKRFVYSPQVKYYYVYNADSTSNGGLNKKKFDYLHFREEIYNYYKKSGDELLQNKAAALYARAAMGLLTRMALFGVSEDIDEKECLKKLRQIFFEHKTEYFMANIISIDRKLIAVCAVYFYPVLKLLRRFFR